MEAIEDSGFARAIPVYARYSAGGYRIVGTSLEYFEFRKLKIQEGRPLLRLGDCVVGAAVAEKKGLKPGDSLISTPETLFDLAGVYPLKMKVVGILEASGTPDDRVIFVDLKTTWVIEGLVHGHDEASELDPSQQLEQKGEDETLRLNASVLEYNEITPGNLDRFHFHGELPDYPVTAAVVIPNDEKSAALVKGRFLAKEGPQLVSPVVEMDELFATVFSVQRFVLWLLMAIGIATLVIGALVFLLSHRLREEEFRHLRNLGADPVTLRALIAFEAGFVVLCSFLVSAIGLLIIYLIAPIVIRHFLN